METRSHLVEVVFDDGWKIAFRGMRFGPYANKSAAVATATEWVANGIKQGHRVTLAVRPAAGAPTVDAGTGTSAGRVA